MAGVADTDYYGLRDAEAGGGSDQGRGDGLPGEALCAGGIAARGGAVRGTASVADRECEVAREGGRILRAGANHWRFAAHGRVERIDSDGGAVACDGVDFGRERHGKGIDRG